MLAAVVSFGWSLSFYFRDMPSVPDPSTGRSYPLNSHGHVTYLTRTEYLEMTGSELLSIAFVGAALVVSWSLTQSNKL